MTESIIVGKLTKFKMSGVDLDITAIALGVSSHSNSNRFFISFIISIVSYME